MPSSSVGLIKKLGCSVSLVCARQTDTVVICSHPACFPALCYHHPAEKLPVVGAGARSTLSELQGAALGALFRAWRACATQMTTAVASWLPISKPPALLERAVTLLLWEALPFPRSSGGQAFIRMPWQIRLPPPPFSSVLFFLGIVEGHKMLW